MNSIQFYLSRLKKTVYFLVFLVLGCLPIVSHGACKLTNLANGAVMTNSSGVIGGPISEIVQNKPSVKPIDLRYHISCTSSSSEVKITIIDSFSQSPVYEGTLKPSIERFKTVLKPTLFTAETRVRFIPQTGGQSLSTIFDPPNDRITGDTGIFTYQGPLEMTMVITNGNKYLFSNIYEPSMRNLFLELYPITIELTDGGNRQKATVFVADDFAANRDKCDVAGFTVTAMPNEINFNISKQALEQGQRAQDNFMLNITRNKSNCTAPLRPKVTFVTSETIINNQDIKLSNGLLLSLKDGVNNQPIEIGKSIAYRDRISDNFQIKYSAELRKNPGEAIKSGPFSTAILYLVEYY